MPIPSPFHSRTAPLCESHQWRDWSGYLAASLYEPTHEREYFAIRNSAGLLDISPLFKYEISGPDALRLVNRIMTRNFNRCRVGQVMYSPWCDEEGKLIHDGNVLRLDEQRFRVTAADPQFRWFTDCGFGMDVQIDDVSEQIAALALQGPKARLILQAAAPDAALDTLPYFRSTSGTIDRLPVTITRTGFTGDLGYEIWLNAQHAGRIWDVLMEAGQPYGILPAGMVALDIARTEAGLLLIGVDYISAAYAVLDAQKSSPFEAGLGWAVSFKKGDFVGRRALLAEKQNGSRWAFVGLEVAWEELERLYGAVGLRPQVAGKWASRAPVPIFAGGKQIGQATTQVFSPLLKKYIAIGMVEAAHAQVGNQVGLEITIEYSHEVAEATIVPAPFFDPPRKKELA